MTTFASEDVAAAAKDPVVAAALGARAALDAGFAAQDVDAVAAVWAPDLIVNSPANMVVRLDTVLGFFRAGRMNYHSLDVTIEAVDGRGDQAPNAGKTVRRQLHRRLAQGTGRRLAADHPSRDGHGGRVVSVARTRWDRDVGSVDRRSPPPAARQVERRADVEQRIVRWIDAVEARNRSEVILRISGSASLTRVVNVSVPSSICGRSPGHTTVQSDSSSTAAAICTKDAHGDRPRASRCQSSSARKFAGCFTASAAEKYSVPSCGRILIRPNHLVGAATDASSSVRAAESTCRDWRGWNRR